MPTFWNKRNTVKPFTWNDTDAADTWFTFGTNRSWAVVAATLWMERVAI